MKNFLMAAMTLVMAVFASCSNDDAQLEGIGDFKVNFTVADKAGFDGDTRAVKTGWDNGDEILIAICSEGGWTELGKYNCFKLKYNGSAWTTDNTGFNASVHFESGNSFMAIYHPGTITLSGTAKDGIEALIGYKGGELLQYIGTYSKSSSTFNLGTIKLKRNPNDFQISVKGLASAGQDDGVCKLYIYDASDESNSTGISYFGGIPAFLTENGFATTVSPFKRSTGINYGDDVVFYFSNDGCQASSLKFVLDDNSSTTYTYTTTTIPQGGKAYTLPAITDDNWE
ncbi:MAG: hypothetical protein J6A40_03110 [Bacteroides sp.]|nr:hypothetical protein [Bacteroides sp.]